MCRFLLCGWFRVLGDKAVFGVTGRTVSEGLPALSPVGGGRVGAVGDGWLGMGGEVVGEFLGDSHPGNVWDDGVWHDF